MKILGIDTATDICGIALTEDKILIAEYRSNIKRAHAEKIIDAIDRVLQDVHHSLSDIEGIAISIGPGSFTGLRIGLSVVKGLTYATRLPVVSVNTLDALASQIIYCDRQICPLIKAQADEAYTALYIVRNFVVERISGYRLINLNQLADLLTERTVIINSGMVNLQSYISPEQMPHVEILPTERSLLSGLTVAQLGYSKLVDGDVEDIQTLEPFYLKDFKAKRSSKSMPG